MLKLGTIEQEARDCRTSFKGVKIGTPVHLCHHETHFEVLTEAAKGRIIYILTCKDKPERALRLRCFRPIIPSKSWSHDLKQNYVAYQKADAVYQKAWEIAHSKAALTSVKPGILYEKASIASLKAWLAFRQLYEVAAHDTDFPNCPWNGKTIFAEEKG